MVEKLNVCPRSTRAIYIYIYIYTQVELLVVFYEVILCFSFELNKFYETDEDMKE
jgi:hypothetical protein